MSYVICALIVALQICGSYCKHITRDFTLEPALQRYLFCCLREQMKALYIPLVFDYMTWTCYNFLKMKYTVTHWQTCQIYNMHGAF